LTIKVIVPEHLQQFTDENLSGKWVFDFNGTDVEYYGHYSTVEGKIKRAFAITKNARFGEVVLLNFKSAGD